MNAAADTQDRVAIEAARVAYQYAMASETGRPVVVHARHHSCPWAAAKLAFAAIAEGTSDVIESHMVELTAIASDQRTHMSLEHVSWPETGLVTPIVTVTMGEPLADEDLYPLLFDLKQQIRSEIGEMTFANIDQIIWIVYPVFDQAS